MTRDEYDLFNQWIFRKHTLVELLTKFQELDAVNDRLWEEVEHDPHEANDFWCDVGHYDYDTYASRAMSQIDRKITRLLLGAKETVTVGHER